MCPTLFASEERGDHTVTISRRTFFRATAASALAAKAGLASAARKRRLNLLWIMTDQQPISTIRAYGGNPTIKTPHLDRIAAEGARFNRFHISAFPCSPSRACFLTGREAHNHGVITNDVLLAPEVPALGDILKKAGYSTGYVGKWHLSGSMYRQAGRKPFDGKWYFEKVADEKQFRYEKVQGGTGEDKPLHGFDHWVGGWEQYRSYLRDVGLGYLVDTTPVGNHNALPSGGDHTHAYSKLPQEHHMAAFFAAEADKFIRARKDSTDPFALVLSFFGPHLPVSPPKPWDDMYPIEQAALPANHHDKLKGKPLRQRINKRCYQLPHWQSLQFRDYIRRYWGYCSYIDHQIGRVLAALDASGKADDTIVLFTSDHGDMVGAHGFVFKLGHCGYDELLRVPFMLRCPGRIEPNTTCDVLAQSVDVLPTLLDLMDVPAPDQMDGRSFLPVLTGKAAHHRDTVICNSMDHNATVITERWKFVLNWNPRDLDELYDLKNDPGEMINLAGKESHADTVADMRARFSRWLTDTAHPYRETILAAMETVPESRIYDLWPEITDFKHFGGNTFEYSYVWHAVQAPPHDKKYWSFTHFANKDYAQDGEIVFRDTTWPDPPTLEWQASKDYAVGPIRVEVPPHAGPGKYAVRIGLYNPATRATPGHLIRGQGNSVTIGELTITKKGGKCAKIAYRPANGRK
jgi:arylsulfatase A-like enzyme